jgi:hypothetical protein
LPLARLDQPADLVGRRAAGSCLATGEEAELSTGDPIQLTKVHETDYRRPKRDSRGCPQLSLLSTPRPGYCGHGWRGPASTPRHPTGCDLEIDWGRGVPEEGLNAVLPVLM